MLIKQHIGNLNLKHVGLVFSSGLLLAFLRADIISPSREQALYIWGPICSFFTLISLQCLTHYRQSTDNLERTILTFQPYLLL